MTYITQDLTVESNLLNENFNWWRWIINCTCNYIMQTQLFAVAWYQVQDEEGGRLNERLNLVKIVLECLDFRFLDFNSLQGWSTNFTSLLSLLFRFRIVMVLSSRIDSDEMTYKWMCIYYVQGPLKPKTSPKE